MHKYLILTLLLLKIQFISSQIKSQTVRGTVIDKETKQPLEEASVVILKTKITIGDQTDKFGIFKIQKVPVGRQNIEVSYLGYETIILKNVLVNSGKELVLTIELVESISDLDEILVQTKLKKLNALNEMATTSVHTFSVEETQRYAASFNDPARFVQTLAGVSGGNDTGNEIVVRGNSPRGVLWRMEGVDIPSPNHFVNPASTGGGVSMLSASVLSTSEFYTGAFPAEYGNALAGVFDINLRTGNNEKREYSFSFGALGTEVSLEGPFSKKLKASYLINYRYSTVAIIKPFLGNLVGDLTPKYQDLTFKINVPTQKYGTFSLFGLGGDNDVNRDNNQEIFSEKNSLGVIGLSNLLAINSKSYLKTTFAYSKDLYNDQKINILSQENNREDFVYKNKFENEMYKIQFLINTKLNKNHILRFGGFFSYFEYFLSSKEKNNSTNSIDVFFDENRKTNLYQMYGQWKWRLKNNLSLHAGIHTAFLALNDTYAIDPRIALKWQLSKNRTFLFSFGKHSKHQHPTSYFLEKTEENEPRNFPNLNLEFTKALHYVIGYNQQFRKNWRLNLEIYYQSLYDVPISTDAANVSSLINSLSIWDILTAGALSNEGSGTNYGIDITLEKTFSNGYYALLTTSLFDSKFTAADNRTYDTRYNGNYLINILYGKEWAVGKNDNLFSVNARVSNRGGNRYPDINTITDNAYEKRYPVYSRLDFNVKYNVNSKKVTHSYSLDIQNILNRKNISSFTIDAQNNKIDETYQLGLLPNFIYRITF